MASIPILSSTRAAHAIPNPLDVLRTGARYLFALCVFVAATTTAAAVGIPFILPWIVLPRGRRERYAFPAGRLWAWLFTRVLLLAKVRVEGREHLPRERGYLVISNHRSWADVPLLVWNTNAQGLGFHLVKYIPFVGQFAYVMGAVFVDLRSRESRQRAAGAVMGLLRARSGNVQLYPEGQCSRTGRIHDRVHLKLIERAWEQGIPVVPAAVFGTEDALPIDKWQARPFARMSLRIAEPLDREGFFDAKSYAEAVWEQVTRMAAALEREHSLLPRP